MATTLDGIFSFQTPHAQHRLHNSKHKFCILDYANRNTNIYFEVYNSKCIFILYFEKYNSKYKIYIPN